MQADMVGQGFTGQIASPSPLRNYELYLKGSAMKKDKKRRIKTNRDKAATRAASDGKKDRNLPTFRKGDINTPQYDKSGKKLYNIVD